MRACERRQQAQTPFAIYAHINTYIHICVVYAICRALIYPILFGARYAHKPLSSLTSRPEMFGAHTVVAATSRARRQLRVSFQPNQILRLT